MIRGFFMDKYLKILLLSCFITFHFSCGNKTCTLPQGEVIQNKYSDNFEIHKTEEGYLLKVMHPSPSSTTDTNKYLLSSKTNDVSSNEAIIHIPVKKVVCLSTTHCAFICTLGEESSIKGVSGTQYVYDNTLKTLIRKNEIVEIGYDSQLNYERIISINPDVVFAYAIDAQGISALQKIQDIGIPVVIINDYIESKPLGRTEWIKFFSCFYDKLDYGIHYFDSIETNYKALMYKNNTHTGEMPKVFVGLPWKGTWWVPGGDSFFANFIEDAGGQYIFDNNDKSESIPLSIEEVFARTNSADIWLHPNNAGKRSDIPEVDARLQDFVPLQQAIIYNNNKRQEFEGGNDFWESGIVHPDIILRDLKHIFYPDSDTLREMYYYKQLY